MFYSSPLPLDSQFIMKKIAVTIEALIQKITKIHIKKIKIPNNRIIRSTFLMISSRYPINVLT